MHTNITVSQLSVVSVCKDDIINIIYVTQMRILREDFHPQRAYGQPRAKTYGRDSAQMWYLQEELHKERALHEPCYVAHRYVKIPNSFW